MREQDIARNIADGIKATAGGRLSVVFNIGLMRYVIYWSYDCPCGETSQWVTTVGDDGLIKNPDDYISHHVKVALAAMRRHVISEGNTPSF